jgi:hypothetical protein
MSSTMQKGVHRRALGIGVRDQVIAPFGLETGGDGKPSIPLPSHEYVTFFDDFLGDLIGDEWTAVEGDTGFSAALANITNGVYRITGSETGGVTHAACGALTTGTFKQWKADMGGRKLGRLRLAARVKSSDTGGGRTHFFVGFSDSGGAEFPAYDTGAGVISNASDLVGVLWAPSSASYSDRFQCVAVKSTTNDSGDLLAVPATAVAPVARVYNTIEVEVRNGIGDTGGAAHFWIDGKKVATINSPVKSDVALSPWIGAWVQDTGRALAFDIDYVSISAPRDTGE